MHKLSAGFALLFLLQIGASAPESSVAAKQSPSSSKGSTTPKSLSSMAAPQAFGDQIVKYFESKNEKKLVSGKIGNATGVTGVTAEAFAGKSIVRPLPTGSVKLGYVPPAPTPRVSVPQIRREIQKILDLNKTVKSVQSGSSAQLQRVQEQARIHQKILVGLESSQNQVGGQEASAKNAFLAQEKLRIIHEETQRNTQELTVLRQSLPKHPLKLKKESPSLSE
jgi:hypothetical protein